jgi:hypothetical protein
MSPLSSTTPCLSSFLLHPWRGSSTTMKLTAHSEQQQHADHTPKHRVPNLCPQLLWLMWIPHLPPSVFDLHCALLESSASTRQPVISWICGVQHKSNLIALCLHRFGLMLVHLLSDNFHGNQFRLRWKLNLNFIFAGNNHFYYQNQFCLRWRAEARQLRDEEAKLFNYQMRNRSSVCWFVFAAGRGIEGLSAYYLAHSNEVTFNATWAPTQLLFHCQFKFQWPRAATMPWTEPFRAYTLAMTSRYPKTTWTWAGGARLGDWSYTGRFVVHQLTHVTRVTGSGNNPELFLAEAEAAKNKMAMCLPSSTSCVLHLHSGQAALCQRQQLQTCCYPCQEEETR